MDAKDFRVLMWRIVKFSMSSCFRFVQKYPTVSGVLLMLLVLYLFLPSVFYLLMYSSPVLVCTGVFIRFYWSTKRPQLQNGVKDGKRDDRTSHVKSKSLPPDLIVDEDGDSAVQAHEAVDGETKDPNSKVVKKEAEMASSADARNNSVVGEKPKERLERKGMISSKLGGRYSCNVSVGNNMAALGGATSEPDLKSIAYSYEHGTKFRGGYSEAEIESSDSEEDAPEGMKKPVEWTEDDQKNLMDLGFSEIERNKRLESLIARRRARKLFKTNTEKGLMDMDVAPPQYAHLLVARSNPFEFPNICEEQMPGSAPSVLLPNKNPFDLPYDPLEERPDLMTDSFQQEFTTTNQKEMVFCRHESFCLGPFVPPERLHEITGCPIFQRPSGKGDHGQQVEHSIQGEKILPRNLSATDLVGDDEGNTNQPQANREGGSKKLETSTGKMENGHEKGISLGKGIETQMKTDTLKHTKDEPNPRSSLEDGGSNLNANRREISGSQTLQPAGFKFPELPSPAHNSCPLPKARAITEPSYNSGIPGIDDISSEDHSFYPNRGNWHTPNNSIASDMQVEVSEVGSPPLTADGTASSDDGESLTYDGDEEKEITSGSDEMWGLSPHAPRAEEVERALREKRASHDDLRRRFQGNRKGGHGTRASSAVSLPSTNMPRRKDLAPSEGCHRTIPHNAGQVSEEGKECHSKHVDATPTEISLEHKQPLKDSTTSATPEAHLEKAQEQLNPFEKSASAVNISRDVDDSARNCKDGKVAKSNENQDGGIQSSAGSIVSKLANEGNSESSKYVDRISSAGAPENPAEELNINYNIDDPALPKNDHVGDLKRVGNNIEGNSGKPIESVAIQNILSPVQDKHDHIKDLKPVADTKGNSEKPNESVATKNIPSPVQDKNDPVKDSKQVADNKEGKFERPTESVATQNIPSSVSDINDHMKELKRVADNSEGNSKKPTESVATQNIPSPIQDKNDHMKDSKRVVDNKEGTAERPVESVATQNIPSTAQDKNDHMKDSKQVVDNKEGTAERAAENVATQNIPSTAQDKTDHMKDSKRVVDNKEGTAERAAENVATQNIPSTAQDKNDHMKDSKRVVDNKEGKSERPTESVATQNISSSVQGKNDHMKDSKHVADNNEGNSKKPIESVATQNIPSPVQDKNDPMKDLKRVVDNKEGTAERPVESVATQNIPSSVQGKNDHMKDSKCAADNKEGNSEKPTESVAIHNIPSSVQDKNDHMKDSKHIVDNNEGNYKKPTESVATQSIPSLVQDKGDHMKDSKRVVDNKEGTSERPAESVATHNYKQPTESVTTQSIPSLVQDKVDHMRDSKRVVDNKEGTSERPAESVATQNIPSSVQDKNDRMKDSKCVADNKEGDSKKPTESVVTENVTCSVQNKNDHMKDSKCTTDNKGNHEKLSGNVAAQNIPSPIENRNNQIKDSKHVEDNSKKNSEKPTENIVGQNIQNTGQDKEGLISNSDSQEQKGNSEVRARMEIQTSNHVATPNTQHEFAGEQVNAPSSSSSSTKSVLPDRNAVEQRLSSDFNRQMQNDILTSGMKENMARNESTEASSTQNLPLPKSQSDGHEAKASTSSTSTDCKAGASMVSTKASDTPEQTKSNKHVLDDKEVEGPKPSKDLQDESKTVVRNEAASKSSKPPQEINHGAVEHSEGIASMGHSDHGTSIKQSKPKEELDGIKVPDLVISEKESTDPPGQVSGAANINSSNNSIVPKVDVKVNVDKLKSTPDGKEGEPQYSSGQEDAMEALRQADSSDSREIDDGNVPSGVSSTSEENNDSSSNNNFEDFVTVIQHLHDQLIDVMTPAAGAATSEAAMAFRGAVEDSTEFETLKTEDESDHIDVHNSDGGQARHNSTLQHQ